MATEPDSFEPPDIYEIDTIEKLRAVLNPLRTQILDCLIPATRTVKEVGDILGIRSNTLYYHVAALEEAGLVQLVDTVVKSGIRQKYYRASGRYFLLQSSLLHANDFEGAVSPGVAFITGVMERSVDELRRSHREGLVDCWMDVLKVSRRVITTSPERAAAFRLRLEALEAEFVRMNDDAAELSIEFEVALFPHYDPTVARKANIPLSDNNRKVN